MAFYLKKMLLAEQNYDIKNKKLLAIIAFFEKQYIYVEEIIEIEIYIDYYNLEIFIKIKSFSRRQVKWLKLLKKYKFKIKKIAGKDNGCVDILN